VIVTKREEGKKEKKEEEGRQNRSSYGLRPSNPTRKNVVGKQGRGKRKRERGGEEGDR